MRHLKIITGNIFKTECQTIVNTVNCVGVMGAGLALECRLRYPAMYEQYVNLCAKHRIDIGLLWLFKASDRWILNFPTKKHWKFPSKESYLHLGLQKFLDTYAAKGITSIAFPLLGAQHGGLDPAQSLKVMESYLSKCSIPVEIYRYDPTAADDLYEDFKANVLSMSESDFRDHTGLRIDYINRLRAALANPRIHQLNQLASVNGIGDKTLEKVFAFVRQRATTADSHAQHQLSLYHIEQGAPANGLASVSPQKAHPAELGL